jgi:hypothetical protein
MKVGTIVFVGASDFLLYDLLHLSQHRIRSAHSARTVISYRTRIQVNAY